MSSERDEQLRHPWLGVEVRHLAALAAVARARSFRGAADELGYVQSAISQQIAQLERVVGARLVERARGHRGVHLTPAGSLLAEHARSLLEVLQAARIDLDTIVAPRTDILHVGMGEGIGSWLLPPMLARLGERLPDVRLEVIEPSGDDDMARLVDTGELDVAIGPLPAERRTFEVRRLLKDPYVLVVPVACAQAEPGKLPAASELCRYRLLAPLDSGDLVALEGQLEAHGLSMAAATRVRLTPAVQDAVASGGGVALMPRLAVDPQRADTKLIDLDAFALPRVICMFWHRRRQTVALLEALTDVVADCVVDIEDRHLALVA
jgi:DNA-binding transcriptional LysR family regulator